MVSSIHEQVTQEVNAVLPERADDMARLCHLLECGEPTVTVIGKYNHGKSMLLNELIGQAYFSVADRRETVVLSDWIVDGVRWLDAPGLDADVGSEDDRRASHAAWLVSDIRLFVHAAKEGELDAAERRLLQELQADGERTRRQTLFVLSQVDQLPDEEALQKVRSAICTQLRSLDVHAVSSARHRKGLDGVKPLLVERSGIPQLHLALRTALERVPTARAHEIKQLFTDIGSSLANLLHGRQDALHALREAQHAQYEAFDTGLRSVLGKVCKDIETMLDAFSTDNVSIADRAEDAYAMTAGKRERAHIQIGYSRACIEIDGFLAGHGVIGLPVAQETAARSLNTVMVAVMGVSVKYPMDLRRMFCNESGRARLQDEFARYYDICTDRQALAARIADTERLVARLDGAMSRLQALQGTP